MILNCWNATYNITMKRTSVLIITTFILIAVIISGCNPDSSIPGAPSTNTDKFSLNQIAEATGRSEEQMVSNFAAVSLFAATKKYGSAPTLENARIEFDEYYISVGTDRYWFWGTYDKKGNEASCNLIIAYENESSYERKIFKKTGSISMTTLAGTFTIAGKNYKINLTGGKYYPAILN